MTTANHSFERDAQKAARPSSWPFGPQEEKVKAFEGNMFLLSRLRPLTRPLKGDSC